MYFFESLYTYNRVFCVGCGYTCLCVIVIGAEKYIEERAVVVEHSCAWAAAVSTFLCFLFPVRFSAHPCSCDDSYCLQTCCWVILLLSYNPECTDVECNLSSDMML